MEDTTTTESSFGATAREIMQCSNDNYSFEDRFIALFACTPEECLILWRGINERPQGGRPVHMLWALLLLRVYAPERVMALFLGVELNFK